MSRLIRFAFTSIATLFGIMALLLMIAAWRVAFVPVSSTTLTPYIESVLSYLIPDAKATVTHSSLEWDNRKQLLTIACEGVDYTDNSGNKVLSLKDAGFKIRLWSLLRGRILPQELNANQAEVWLVRDQTGLISFGGAKPEKPRLVTDEAIDFAFLQYISDEIANPNLRQNISIKNSVFHVRDESFGQDWSITIPEIALAHDKKSAKGEAKIELVEKERTSALQMQYDFDYAKKLHNVSLQFQDIKPSVFATRHLSLAKLKIAEFPVSGAISLSTDRELNIAKASVKLDGGRGFLREPDFWDKPRSVEGIAVLVNYDNATDMLEVSRAEINFGGPRLNLTLSSKISPPKDILWLKNKLNNDVFTLNITLDNLPMDQFGEVWPKTIIPDARNWIVTSMSKGLFTHGELTLKGRAKLDDLENLTLTSGGGKIAAQDGVVNYLEGMPAVLGASAEATFDLEHMEVKILSGSTGAIKLQPFTLVMDHFQEDTQYITIPLKLTGPVKDVLTVLDSPPLGYAKAVGLSPADSTGNVEGTLTLNMPLLDALLLKDVGVKAEAKITDFGAKTLVPGIEVSQGNLDLDLNKDGFTLRGNVGLNKVISQLTWRSNFGGGSKNTPLHDGSVTATLRGDQWGLFYGLDSLGKITGETPATIHYVNMAKGDSKVSGSVNLKNAGVKLRDIGWDKPVGAAAQLAFTLDIKAGKSLRFSNIELTGPGIKAKGTADLDEPTGKLTALQFKPFILGRSNATVSYTRPVDPKLPLSITLEGESFDLFGLEEEKAKDAATKAESKDKASQDPEAKRPKDYSLKLLKLYTSEDGFMASIKGRASRDELGWKDIDMWGVAQGVTPVAIKLLPDRDRLAFNMNADNFGNALQGMGFGKGVKSGRIEVNGESTAADPRTITGKIKIDSFTVEDLPVLARLLSAMSPFGFVDLITGKANFDRLRSDYTWKGSDVELRELRAAGSVVGINLDGHLDIETGKAYLVGTVVPFSFMNSIIGAIPLLGDVITGGNGGGIIAASFTVRGELSNPDISVNPVSLLAPGILRRIFFSGDATEEQKGEGAIQPAVPDVVAKPEQPKSQNNLSKKKAE